MDNPTALEEALQIRLAAELHVWTVEQLTKFTATDTPISAKALLIAIQERRAELDKQYDKFRAVIGLKGGNTDGST